VASHYIDWFPEGYCTHTSHGCYTVGVIPVDATTRIERPDPNQDRPADAKRVYQGIIYDVYQWEQELFDGSTRTFERITQADSVDVVAVKDGQIVLAHEEQPGSKPFTGTMGGRIDDGETPLEAAQRELREESGLVSDNWVLWFASQPSSKIDRAIYVFIAKDCRQAETPNTDAGEKITLRQISFDDFVISTKQPEFRDRNITIEIASLEVQPYGLAKLRQALGL
jgi:ADP-ribose pyrophosphatase